MAGLNGKRRFWAVFHVVALVAVGGFALWNMEYAKYLLWGLWVSAVMNALEKLSSEPRGVALIRKEMSPTDLPPDAKIPRALLTDEERSNKL